MEDGLIACEMQCMLDVSVDLSLVSRQGRGLGLRGMSLGCSPTAGGPGLRILLSSI